MTVTSRIVVNDILNRVAAEVGLEIHANPYTSGLQHFTQMGYLLQTCGEELCLAHQWEFLNESHQITTVNPGDTGDYPLPTDFHYMIQQTGWERKSNVPLFGPLSAQDWTYLLGRDLVSQTIYASFRLKDGMFSVFPQPPPDGLDINFEYQRITWVDDGTPDTFVKDINAGSDIVQFDRTLITRMLKVKWLEAKGFDTTKSQDDFNQVFQFITGKDKGAEILSVSGNRSGYPFLGAGNFSDSGYGL